MPNAISAINDGDVNSKPLVQVMDVKLIGTNQERHRLLLSYSTLTQHAMLSTQLNDRVKTGSVRSIVQLIDYICSTVQNRKIIVVPNMGTIIPDCDLIGNPRMYADSDAAAQKAPANISSGNVDRVSNNAMKGRPAVQNVQSFQPAVLAPYRTAPRVDQNIQNFRPVVQPPYQPPPNYRSHGPILKNEAPACVIPISALNPYRGRWAIKARVTAKGDLRRYNNARGDGKVFSFDLLDSDGGEIRVTCFNAVVDRFYDVIEVGKVYMISKGSLKPAQKNFNHLKNEWEIFLETTSSVDPYLEEDVSIPQQQFSFRPISEVENVENNSILDFIGVVVSVNPSVLILRKNGLETQ